MYVIVLEEFVVCFVWVMFKDGKEVKLKSNSWLCVSDGQFGYGGIGRRVDARIQGGTAWRPR